MLDPRFRRAAELSVDLTAAAMTRESNRRFAEMYAGQAGLTLDEAMALAGLAPASAAPLSVQPPAYRPSECVAAALLAAPDRSDRDLARECICSPTTIGKARAFMGLDRCVRSVHRLGQAYAMTVGGLSGRDTASGV